jgi:hypothetical protein
MYRFHSYEHLLAPALPPVSLFARKRGRIVLDLAPGAVTDLGRGTCDTAAELCGYPADYITAMPSANPGEEQTRILLIAGYAVGPWYAPEWVLTRAFALQYQPNGHVAFDPRPCQVRAGGRPSNTTVQHPVVGKIGPEMEQEWSAAEDVVCN